METTDLAELKITVNPADMDEEKFVSIWNIASATMGGESGPTRILASKLIGFLCKHRCALVVVTQTDATYLDEWFERDNKILYDWSAESEKVDVITQYAHVPYELFCSFLKLKKFKPEANYSPRRADRVEWFTEEWNVG